MKQMTNNSIVPAEMFGRFSKPAHILTTGARASYSGLSFQRYIYIYNR